VKDNTKGKECEKAQIFGETGIDPRTFLPFSSSTFANGRKRNGD